MSVKKTLSGPTNRGQLYSLILSLSGIKRHFRRKLESGGYPDRPDPPPRRLLGEFDVREDLLAGRRVWRIAPHQPATATRRSVLYLHGGAYVANIQSIHWDLIEQLIRKAGITVIVPDYPLAPTACYLETYQFTADLYGKLLQEFPARDMVFMGDSAGGGLALGFCQQLRDRSAPLPRRLILLSPWLDITLGNPQIPAVQGQDRMLDMAALRSAGRAYARELDPRDSRVSPIYGSLQGLPPISLFTGTRELLMPDARKLKAMLEEEGSSLDYHEYTGMFHAWVTIYRLPEARRAIAQIISLLQEPDLQSKA